MEYVPDRRSYSIGLQNTHLSENRTPIVWGATQTLTVPVAELEAKMIRSVAADAQEQALEMTPLAIAVRELETLAAIAMA